LAKAIHSMIRVLDEARSVDFYGKAFGLEIADRFGFDGFTLIYLRNGEADFEVELTVNHAFAVDDLDAEHARFTTLGLNPNPIKEFFREGSLLAKFFFVTDPDGYKIEVLQRHGRYK
jgi:lactoylglutathione lyase